MDEVQWGVKFRDAFGPQLEECYNERTARSSAAKYLSEGIAAEVVHREVGPWKPDGIAR